MKTNIFYHYGIKEYTLAERHQVEEIIGAINLEYAEEIAREKFEREGFGCWEIDIPTSKMLCISIEREVDDDDDSEELNVVGDEEGIFSDLTLNTVEF